MLGSILQDTKILKIADSAAAAKTVVTSDTVDTQGYEGVCFICKLGAVVNAGAVSMAIYQGEASDMSDEGALSGASAAIATTDTDSEQSLIVDVIKPRERYLRAKVTRATQNSEVDAMFAILYNPKQKPVTQPSTVDASTQVVSPAEA